MKIIHMIITVILLNITPNVFTHGLLKNKSENIDILENFGEAWARFNRACDCFEEIKNNGLINGDYRYDLLDKLLKIEVATINGIKKIKSVSEAIENFLNNKNLWNSQILNQLTEWISEGIISINSSTDYIMNACEGKSN